MSTEVFVQFLDEAGHQIHLSNATMKSRRLFYLTPIHENRFNAVMHVTPSKSFVGGWRFEPSVKFLPSISELAGFHSPLNGLPADDERFRGCIHIRESARWLEVALDLTRKRYSHILGFSKTAAPALAGLYMADSHEFMRLMASQDPISPKLELRLNRHLAFAILFMFEDWFVVGKKLAERAKLSSRKSEDQKFTKEARLIELFESITGEKITSTRAKRSFMREVQRWHSTHYRL